MLLLVSLQRRLGKLYPLTPRTLRRCTLGTNGIEVASRRYGLRVSNGISTRRRSGEATVKGVDRSIQLQLRAILQCISIGDDVEDSMLQLCDCLDLIAFFLGRLRHIGWVTMTMTHSIGGSSTHLIKARWFTTRLATIPLGCCHSWSHTTMMLGSCEGMGTLQLCLRESTVGEHGSFANRARGEDTTYELLCRLEIFLVKAMLIARVIEGLRSMQAIKTSLGISYGISGHSQHSRGNLCRCVRDTCDVELTIDFLRSYFFCEVINALNLLRCVGLGQKGV